jgi:hypothetical protein
MEILKSAWIDKYLLRYAPGTLFGAFFMAYLYFRRVDFGFPINTAIDKIALGSVFLVGGFLFAYLASAPILVFHSTRSLHLRRGITKRTLVKQAISMVTVIAFVVYLLMSFNVGFQLAFAAGCAFGAWFITLALAIYACRVRDDIFKFYRKLCNKRLSEKTDIAESYRTMREHGNAFFVIFWEIFLASIILVGLKLKVVIGYDNLLFVTLSGALLWVLPATMSWYIAGRIEVDFVNEH